MNHTNSEALCNDAFTKKTSTACHNELFCNQYSMNLINFLYEGGLDWSQTKIIREWSETQVSVSISPPLQHNLSLPETNPDLGYDQTCD